MCKTVVRSALPFFFFFFFFFFWHGIPAIVIEWLRKAFCLHWNGEFISVVGLLYISFIVDCE